ncbi:winged helix-turn-helix domain-containing protein [Candidatus Seribacter sulfatis]
MRNGKSTNTIDNYIVKLRRKLENTPKSPRHLLTCHGEGYRWKPN